jgi:hypothetical protein
MAIQTLTGNEFESGSAIDNTQTDQFILTGSGNFVETIGGNVKVTGINTTSFGPDTNSTVLLSESDDITANIAVHGNNNSVVGVGDLTGSTVSFTVSGLGSGVGGNSISLNNFGGSTTANLAGPSDVAILNSDATNVVSTGADVTGHGNAIIAIGAPFDDNFGFTTSVTAAGSGNEISVGDANATVNGGTSNNTIALGDGENTVAVSGTKNTISVGGGDNTINAGSGTDAVFILGIDGASLPAFADPLLDDPLGPNPTDIVTIAGANDLVTGTYEDVTVLGTGVTSAATIDLGDGDNTILLNGTGGDAITVGKGTNSIRASGNLNVLALGAGDNQIVLSGNGNTATVTDTTGTGTDNFQIQGGVGDSITFGMAGGSVTGTATTGITTITQALTSANQVNVNLGNGAGKVTLGNGHDTVTANGAASIVKVGSGVDTITANGAGDAITFGNGADTVTANGAKDNITGGNGSSTITANGAGDVITLGNGANKLTANGIGDTIKVGNGNNTITATGSSDTITAGNGANTITGGSLATIVAGSGNNTITAGGSATITAGNGNDTVTATGNGNTVTLGSGNDSVTALGSGDKVTIGANSLSVDKVALGSSSSLAISGGTDTISLAGAGDTVKMNNLLAGSKITANGNGSMLFLGSNSSADVALNPVGTGENLTVQALTGSKAYTGLIEVSGFGAGDTLNLDGLGFNSFAGVLAAMKLGPTQDVLALQGGGHIAFDMPTAFSPTEFKFSSTFGAV